MNPDFGKTVRDYSRHRQGFPEEMFRLLTALDVTLDGARAVDLGTGTGSLARGFARRGATVTGVDPSADLTAEALRLDLEWGVHTHYVNATAEKTTLESGGYDVVASGQSWWWFDRTAALSEATRILKPGGSLIICSFDWVPRPGSVAELTERLIEKHNPGWDMGGGNGLHPDFVSDLKAGGFESVRSDHAGADARYTKDAWRGRVRASAGIGATLSPEAIHAFDREHALALDRFSSSDPITVPHVVFAALGQKSAS